MAARRRRTALLEWRVFFLGFLVLLGCAALVVRLWWVQVSRGDYYASKLGNRSQVTVRIPAVRGEIRDRNGIPLVQNRASYEVAFYLPDMVRGYKQRVGHAPLTSYRGTIYGMPKDIKVPDIVQIVNTAVVPRLQELDLARDYNSEDLFRHFKNDREVPFTYLEDLDFPTIARYSEHDVGLPGVDIAVQPVREYVYGAFAPHLLGYVGAVNEVSAEPDVGHYNFYQADVVGKSQVELYMDKYLRGKPGVRKMQRNVKNVIDKELEVVPPQPGNNVYLTIDARIQMITEEALRSVGRGAAVVVDPNNGDILAMASVPSYDPNVFIPSISEKAWEELRQNEAHPLVNRAVSAYPPGSTFKIVTALGGLREDMANSRFNCSGGVTYGNHYFKCWIAEKGGAHGTLGLSEAMKVSCNSFFYQYANAAGIDAIAQVGKLLGLGEISDLPLTGESPGVLPSKEWLNLTRPRERWTSAYTANVSIGQGYDLVSPLQSAMVAATVANGGISYAPRLIAKVLDANGNPALDEDGNPVVPRDPTVRADLHALGVTDAQMAVLRQGLWRAVNEQGGTGGRARLKEVQVAGKTGTAQAMRGAKKDTIAWFTCFAPFKEPRYAITVMVQGGAHGGSVAAPIADSILKQSLAMDQNTFQPKLAALKPAQHPNPFKMIEAVTFSEDGPQLQASTDEEVTSGSQAPEAPQVQQVSAKPKIRMRSDERGRVRVRRAEPVRTAPPPKKNFFQRVFGAKEPKQRR